MKPRTQNIVIVLVLLAVVAFCVGILLWNIRDAEAVDAVLYGEATQSGHITATSTVAECPPQTWAVANSQTSSYTKYSYKGKSFDYYEHYVVITFDISGLTSAAETCTLYVTLQSYGNADSPAYVAHLDVHWANDCVSSPNLAVADTSCMGAAQPADTTIDYNNLPAPWSRWAIPVPADKVDPNTANDFTVIFAPQHWWDTNLCALTGANQIKFTQTQMVGIWPQLNITYETEEEEVTTDSPVTFQNSRIKRGVNESDPLRRPVAGNRIRYVKGG